MIGARSSALIEKKRANLFNIDLETGQITLLMDL